MLRKIFFALLSVVLLGLGSTGMSKVHVMLDFFANPNHVPLFAAKELGFFAAEGVAVEILVPANPSDPVKLAAAGTIEVSLTPQINFLIAKAAGLPLTAIGALIETPLGGLLSLADYGIETLPDLQGGRIGYSLTPLEPILWRTMLGSVDVGADQFELVNVGFNTVLALLSHQVDAIGAFRNFETIQVKLLDHEPIYFPQEDYGVPDTYEILLVTSTELIETRPSALQALLTGLARGIAYTSSNPEEAFNIFLQAHPDLDDELNRRAYTATLPLYAKSARHDEAQKWARLQEYLLDTGLMKQSFPLSELYTTRFLTSR